MRVVVDYGMPFLAGRRHTVATVDALSRSRSAGATAGREVTPVVVIRAAGHDAATGTSTAAPGPERTTDEARSLDRNVRAHERTHQTVLGPYAGSGIELTTRRGASGEPIATGGRIRADLTPIPGDPRATIRKADAVRRAALAVGSPSAADMRVAAEAYRMAQQAGRELRAEREPGRDGVSAPGTERRVDTVA